MSGCFQAHVRLLLVIQETRLFNAAAVNTDTANFPGVWYSEDIECQTQNISARVDR